MAEKPYRFLLRMPEHLRRRLAASAHEHGLSINAELVRRLEQSLDQELRVSARTRVASAWLAVAALLGARVRPALGFATVFAVVVTLGVVGATRWDSGGRPDSSYGTPASSIRVPFPGAKARAQCEVATCTAGSARRSATPS